MEKILVKDKTKQIESINPATGENIGYSPIHSVSQFKEILKTAKQAQINWAAVPLKERVKSIKKIRDYLLQNKDILAETISKDNGKTLLDALATEIMPSAFAVSFYCKRAGRMLKDQKLASSNIFLSNKRSKIVNVPYGVIGIFSPWNYPFSIPFSEVIMGLLAGNAIILKVASETQAVGLALKKCIEYAELPDGIFSYVNMPGKIAGDAFLGNGIDKLCFTGSVPVGNT